MNVYILLPQGVIRQPQRKQRQLTQSPKYSQGKTLLLSSESQSSIGVNLAWREGESAPQRICSVTNAVATLNHTMYMNDDHTILAYDVSRSTNSWSRLPDCPYHDSSLAVINNMLTTIGGRSDLNSTTNKLFSFTEEGGNKSWTEKFPSMPTRRSDTTALCTGIFLIVNGGVKGIDIPLRTVEVMNTETLQWCTAADLPHPTAGVTSSALCSDQIFIVNTWKGVLYKCKIDDILQSCTTPSSCELPPYIKPSVQWNQVAALPIGLGSSTCVSINDKLLAFGRSDYNHATAPVHMYDFVTNSWTIISHMSTAVSRVSCIAAVLPDNQLVVVGGFRTNSVEIAKLT